MSQTDLFTFDTSPARRYDPSCDCPACQHTVVTTKYAKARDLHSDASVEFFIRACGRCGFSWTESLVEIPDGITIKRPNT